MEWAALVTWVVTALGGFTLLGLWIARGGLQEGPLPGRRIHPPLVGSHLLLAAGGLVLWIVYLAVDRTALAWLAFGILSAVALLGFAMFFGWARSRGAVQVEAVGSTQSTRPAESSLPLPVALLHGMLGAATLVLVFLTAAGVGD
jgi:hypothetical protein